MFAIKFNNKNCWIADWEGDPGRTLLLENAKTYKNHNAAQKELDKIIMKNRHRKMDLTIVKLS